jgi:MoxR-like ATPase
MSETRTVTAIQARRSLTNAFKIQRPVFLWGPPGIGKSELVAELTEEMGGYMIDLRLGQMEPTDIRGIPFYNKDLGLMDWAPPIDLPSEELASKYPVVGLFFDEMNRANEWVKKSLMNFLKTIISNLIDNINFLIVRIKWPLLNV